MVDGLILISIDVLPNVVYKDNTTEEERKSLERYIEDLKLGKENVKNEISRLLGTDSEMGESEFVIKISGNSSQLNQILTSSGIRHLARHLSGNSVSYIN